MRKKMNKLIDLLGSMALGLVFGLGIGIPIAWIACCIMSLWN